MAFALSHWSWINIKCILNYIWGPVFEKDEETSVTLETQDTSSSLANRVSVQHWEAPKPGDALQLITPASLTLCTNNLKKLWHVTYTRSQKGGKNTAKGCFNMD